LVFAVLVAVVIASVMRAPGGVIGRVFAVRPLVVIGVISYGIYLWHWPIIVYATEDRTGLSGAGLYALQIALTLAAAGASYLLVERPIRHGMRTRRAWMWAPAGLAAGMVGLLVTTAGATDGPCERGALHGARHSLRKRRLARHRARWRNNLRRVPPRRALSGAAAPPLSNVRRYTPTRTPWRRLQENNPPCRTAQFRKRGALAEEE